MWYWLVPRLHLRRGVCCLGILQGILVAKWFQAVASLSTLSFSWFLPRLVQSGGKLVVNREHYRLTFHFPSVHVFAALSPWVLLDFCFSVPQDSYEDSCISPCVSFFWAPVRYSPGSRPSSGHKVDLPSLPDPASFASSSRDSQEQEFIL